MPPLAALTGLAAGTLALLASARPVHGPDRLGYCPTVTVGRYDGGCAEVPAPVPSHGVSWYNGVPWDLAHIPGGSFTRLDLHGARWAGVSLQGAYLDKCDLKGCNLRGAHLRDATFVNCDLTYADLTDADLTGVTSVWTSWPAGFDPQAHGARPEARRDDG
jgi:hypothetical protein